MRFSFIRAYEEIDARDEVIEWADELYEDQAQTWEARAASGSENKERHATLQECRDKSRDIRRKRERDHRYFNQTTSRNPLY